MDEREKIFEEINSCTDPSSIKDEYLSNSDHVARFKNIFAFLDVCKSRRVTTENSITYYLLLLTIEFKTNKSISKGFLFEQEYSYSIRHTPVQKDMTLDG